MTRRARCLSLLLALLAASLSPALAYTVRPGDTLYGLANKEGVAVSELVKLNHLSGTDLTVGQQLSLPSEARAQEVGGVRVQVPSLLHEGDAFSVRLSGPRAPQARVRFLSETGEDVRSPAEDLAPFGAADAYVVLGRVVLGQKKPLVYEVRVGDEVLRGSVPVVSLKLQVQNLNLPPAIADKRQDPARAEEEALVERAYARRTPQVWTRPFLGISGARPISTAFGQTRHYTAGEALKYHYGIDYPFPVGTPVQAINDGTVVVAGQYPVRGGLVVIDHGAGVVSLYMHQSRLLVKVGDKVTRGQKIGLVGTTGLSNGPHLHLELRVRGEAVDPKEFYNKLLP